MTKPLIEIHNVYKVFAMGDEEIIALNALNLKIFEGEMVSIVGTSGSGKSTLMNILGLLDLPTKGTYRLDGIDASLMNDSDLSTLRNEKIGFVFQSFHLLPRMNALSNVELPLHYRTVKYNEGIEALSDTQISEKALLVLDKVGIKNRAHHKPNELSGGQRQRVAVARALVNSPKILLADEPTGALDSKTSEEILTLFKNLNREGVTVIIVTHDQKVAENCRRIIRMSDGKIISDTTHEQTL